MVRELYDRKVFPVRVLPLNEDTVQLDVIWQILPSLGIMTGVLSDIHTLGVPEHTGNEDLTFIIGLGDGGAVFRQRRREVTMVRGSAIVATREDGGFTCLTRAGRFIGLRIPRKAIEPFVSNVDDAIMRLIPSSTGPLALLVKYVEALAQDEFATSAEYGRLITTHIHDLVATTLGTCRDVSALLGARGVRAARIRTIKAEIETNLANCSLDAACIAKRHGISTRYLHKLFESEGITFTEFLLDRRLALAHRKLSDTRFVGHSISSIAFEMGFGDISHFNRCFRRRYGTTPSDIRMQAKASIDKFSR
jgi:AraC-like DNA-binding protein